MEWSNNSTQGHWETASEEGKTGETSASANEGKLDAERSRGVELVSGVNDSVILESVKTKESPRL